MPTLTRIVMVLLIAAALAYAAIYALANFVSPQQRDISIPVPERSLDQK